MPPLLTAEGLGSLVFIVFIIMTISGALIAANSVRLIRSVSGLALSFFGLAGLFYFLNSPFVALMEILIYVGAVCVTIVFGIMLAEPRQEDKGGTGKTGLAAPIAIGAAGVLFWAIMKLNTATQWTAAASRENAGTVEDIGRALLTNYSMVFELISLVLLVAILGALVIARAGREKS